MERATLSVIDGPDLLSLLFFHRHLQNKNFQKNSWKIEISIKKTSNYWLDEVSIRLDQDEIDKKHYFVNKTNHKRERTPKARPTIQIRFNYPIHRISANDIDSWVERCDRIFIISQNVRKNKPCKQLCFQIKRKYKINCNCERRFSTSKINTVQRSRLWFGYINFWYFYFIMSVWRCFWFICM